MTMQEILLGNNDEKWIKEMELEASEYGPELNEAWDELEDYEEG